MLFLLTNRTRPNLSSAQYGEFAVLAKAFYASMPGDVKSAANGPRSTSRATFRLLEAPDVETVRRIQAPFEAFTETQIVPVAEIRGWARVMKKAGERRPVSRPDRRVKRRRFLPWHDGDG